MSALLSKKKQNKYTEKTKPKILKQTPQEKTKKNKRTNQKKKPNTFWERNKFEQFGLEKKQIGNPAAENV